MEEKKLIELAREGSKESFSLLVERYKTKVFGLVFSLTRDRENADDLAQEVFIKAYSALPRFEMRSGFGTWLYRIAVNHTKDYLRKRKSKFREISIDDVRDISFLTDDDLGKNESEQIEERRRQLVHKALKSLPEKHQVIVSLRDIQGFSYQEISKILRISPGTVDSRLHRARKLLRKKLVSDIDIKGGNHGMQAG